MNHPTPWQIKYWRRCEEWDEKSNPYIVDANGNTVVEMPQHVGHPGEYDQQADDDAHRIINSVNAPHVPLVWLPATDPPLHGEIVFVSGGLGQYRDGKWYSATDCPPLTREIEWEVTHWARIRVPVA